MSQQVSGFNLSKEVDYRINESQDVLRLITCGSVDDGKSTLIGRLLYESKVIYKDQLESLKADSKKYGTTGEELDFSLLVDGLTSEREQNITIDVAYKFFTTPKRKFIIADTPGHEQYTRNMATGASTADVAIVLIDARKGILPQTRRHTLILNMLGIKNIILLINKIDLVDYNQEFFLQIEKDYKEFIKNLNIEKLHSIPVSSLYGDNIITSSERMKWYTDVPLLTYLETIPLNEQKIECPFRMPVQLVNRPHLDFRGFMGTVASGTIRIGDKITVLPSGKKSTVKNILANNFYLEKANIDQSITILLEDEIDICRGDVLADSEKPCQSADQFESYLLWMSENKMFSHQQYIFQAHKVSTPCTINNLKYQVDINTSQPIVSKTLQLNEIGVCEISLTRPIPFEPYTINRKLGAFILVDRLTNETVAAGMIRHALRRSLNVHKQHFEIDTQARSSMKGQKPCVIWLTGLPSSGKSTIANALENALHGMDKHTMLLDGDNMRLRLNRDLGFTNLARAENIRRIAEVSKLMTEAGLITLVSCISPLKADRTMAKEIIEEEKFIEVYVNTPLEEAEKRDVKGLYKKARAGEIPNFTGIGSPYENPETPHMYADTIKHAPKEIADQIIIYLSKNGFLN